MGDPHLGPVWRDGKHHEPTLLASCYRSSFELALEHNVKTIAFPAISTGVYRFPKDQAAGIAVGAMREYEEEFDEIVACCFSEEDFRLYERVLAGK